MNAVFDVEALPKTSTKKNFPWRETRVALVRVASSGVIEHAGLIAEKVDLLRRSTSDDCVLAIRLLSIPQPRPEVLVVDNRPEAIEILS